MKAGRGNGAIGADAADSLMFEQVAQERRKNKSKSAASLTIIHYNGNAWRSVHDYGTRHKEAVVCSQETKLASEALLNVRETMAGERWGVSFAAATKTQEVDDQRCRSAGVMVAVPAHLASAAPWPFDRDDLSPDGAPGRLTGRWIQTLGGLLVMSVYFSDSTGWCDINTALATQIAEITALTPGMWILAGD
jgi:hypothetical protein